MTDDHTLKILEAYTRDVGRGVARIDYDSMDSLSASTGDVVEIEANVELLPNVYLSILRMKVKGLLEQTVWYGTIQVWP